MVDANLYRELILEHFRSPQFAKPLHSPQQELVVTNSSCGDEVTVQLRWEGNRLNDLAFLTKGCAVSVAAASVLGEMIKGKSKAEISRIALPDLLTVLGINPGPSRLRCASLALEGLGKLLAEKEHLHAPRGKSSL